MPGWCVLRRAVAAGQGLRFASLEVVVRRDRREENVDVIMGVDSDGFGYDAGRARVGTLRRPAEARQDRSARGHGDGEEELSPRAAGLRFHQGSYERELMLARRLLRVAGDSLRNSFDRYLLSQAIMAIRATGTAVPMISMPQTNVRLRLNLNAM